MMKKDSRKLVDNVLERRAQWKRLYSQQYYERFFTLYDGELEALFTAARFLIAESDSWKKHISGSF